MPDKKSRIETIIKKNITEIIQFISFAEKKTQARFSIFSTTLFASPNSGMKR